MAAAVDTSGDGIAAKRNRAIAAALCKRFSVDPANFSSDTVGSYDIMGLFSNILQLSSNEVLANKEEVMKWVTFASNFPRDSVAAFAALKGLNGDLHQSSVLLGSGLSPSVADIVVFCALHAAVSQLNDADAQAIPNLMRWMDYIQNKEDFGGALETILINKPKFEPQSSKKATNNEKAVEESKKNTNPSKEDKTKTPEITSSGKDMDVSITVLNLQVGLIRKAWKHPSADSLLVEEIDVGEGNLRQVVSGLAKYCSPEELTNRLVVLITNVKPGKLRDIMSAGLVLCASNEDHTIVEPLKPPEGAIIGERISFVGYDGKPEDVLNPKKKQLEKITPHLYTDDAGVATYKGIPFMTSAGPCMSSVTKAGIK